MNIHAQNTVSGTVKDGNGEPLLGVSVIVKHGKQLREPSQTQWTLSSESRTERYY